MSGALTWFRVDVVESLHAGRLGSQISTVQKVDAHKDLELVLFVINCD